MKERWRRGKIVGKWKQERMEFFKDREVDDEGEEVSEYERLEERDRIRQRRERWERINDSRYNRWYKEIKEQEIPEYLKKGWSEERWRRVSGIG
ncbi:hypothetical protein RF55_20734 [Lasius niger]|uniref:Uncharacterized protein n=1 Tax=Lasius niger TaxID=67767 RepID=A0A0J7MRN0_LASNI|nr:hypothetical protein RF55_20734 [Lasius niger]